MRTLKCYSHSGDILRLCIHLYWCLLISQVGLASSRSLGGDWRRRPGRPRARWTDQLRNDTGSVFTNLWRQTDRQTDRPFYGAMVEQRDGPSWLRDDDDDNELVTGSVYHVYHSLVRCLAWLRLTWPLTVSCRLKKVVVSCVLPSSHRLSVNVLLNNITFLWFLLFSMYESLHVAVKMYINYSFFTFIKHLIKMQL